MSDIAIGPDLEDLKYRLKGGRQGDDLESERSDGTVPDCALTGREIPEGTRFVRDKKTGLAVCYESANELSKRHDHRWGLEPRPYVPITTPSGAWIAGRYHRL